MIKKINFIGIIVLLLFPFGFSRNIQQNNLSDASIKQQSIILDDDYLTQASPFKLTLSTREVTEPIILSAYVDSETKNSVVFHWKIYDPSNAVTNIALKDEDTVLLTLNELNGSVLIENLKTRKYNNWHLEVTYEDDLTNEQIIDQPIAPFPLIQTQFWIYVMIGIIVLIILIIILMFILYRYREKRLLKTILAQEQAEWDQHDYY